MCLDHQPTRDANGKPLPAVTGKHYNHAQCKNMETKRKVCWIAGPPSCAGSSARRNPTIWNSVSRREGCRRSRDATDVTNREAAICWDGAA